MEDRIEGIWETLELTFANEGPGTAIRRLAGEALEERRELLMYLAARMDLPEDVLTACLSGEHRK